MRHSIHVQYSDGSKARSTKVTLGTRNGMSQPAITDRYGEARIDTSCSGPADVYVNGRRVGVSHGNASVTI